MNIDLILKISSDEFEKLTVLQQDSESVEEACKRVLLVEAIGKKMLSDLKFRNPEFTGTL
jgi:hypothetical protein